MIESVTAILIPRISELQMLGDKREIIALSGRSMNKLALVFLPFYAFLFVTAEPFIVTLFSRDYIASVPIFLINLTLIPFAIWINDPVVRAFPELGRFLLYLRIALLVGMTATLVVGINASVFGYDPRCRFGGADGEGCIDVRCTAKAGSEPLRHQAPKGPSINGARIGNRRCDNILPALPFIHTDPKLALDAVA